jgi:Clp amino terminal domain, pathogenicity island component
MMPIRMTPDARLVSMNAFDAARRLGHGYIGGAHFLLAVAAAGPPVGVILRERGVTPERVETEIIRLSGAGLFGDLDRDALASIGIDVDAVRARIEASFGQEALTRANQAVRREPAVPSWDPRRVRRTGAERDGVFLPHTPGATRSVQYAHAEAAHRGTQIGVEHLALGLLAVQGELVPPILSALGVSVPELRTAILGRYREAS